MNNTAEIIYKENTKDLISIIVPCYNEEKRRCLHFTGQFTDAVKGH